MTKPGSSGKKKISLCSLQKGWRHYFHPLPVLQVLTIRYVALSDLDDEISDLRKSEQTKKFPGVELNDQSLEDLEKFYCLDDTVIAKLVSLTVLFFRSKRLYSACVHGVIVCGSKILLVKEDDVIRLERKDVNHCTENEVFH